MSNAVRGQPTVTVDWDYTLRNHEQWQQVKDHFDDPIPDQRFILPRCVCHGPSSNANQDLRTAIGAARSFRELCPLVRHAEVRLSFWGSRYIQVQGYRGTLPIDALAKRVMELIKQNPNFDQHERSHGKTIAPIIDQIYDQSDKQVAEGAWFTKVFFWFRNIPNLIAGPSFTRWIWKDCDETLASSFPVKSYHKFFKYYTKEQHERDVGPIRERQIIGGHGPDYKYWSPEDIPRQMTVEELRSQMQMGWVSDGDALQICAANGFIDILEQILQNGPRRNMPMDANIDFAIVFAAQNKHSECLRLLLEKHAHRLDPIKFTRALNLAKFNGDLASIEILRTHLPLPLHRRG